MVIIILITMHISFKMISTGIIIIKHNNHRVLIVFFWNNVHSINLVLKNSQLIIFLFKYRYFFSRTVSFSGFTSFFTLLIKDIIALIGIKLKTPIRKNYNVAIKITVIIITQSARIGFAISFTTLIILWGTLYKFNINNVNLKSQQQNLN